MMDIPLDSIICHDVAKPFPLPDNCIDVGMTSPPYWGLRDYGEQVKSIFGGNPNCKHVFTEYHSKLAHENRQNLDGGTVGNDKFRENLHGFGKAKAGFCQKCGAWRGQLGLEPHPQMYIDHLVMICQEIKRVLKKSGSFYLNLGDTYGTHASGSKKYAHNFQKPNIASRQGIGTIEKPKQNGWYREKQLMLIPSRVAIALQEGIQRDLSFQQKKELTKLEHNYYDLFIEVDGDYECTDEEKADKLFDKINKIKSTVGGGWILRNSIIWHKPNPMPSSVKDRLNTTYEYVFHFTTSDAKSDWYLLTGEPDKEKYPEKNKIWRQIPNSFRQHPHYINEIKKEWLSCFINLDYYYDLDAIREPHKFNRWGGRYKKNENVKVRPDEIRAGGQGSLNRMGYDCYPNPLGRNPGDVLEYNSKYIDHDHGQTLQGFIRDQSIVKGRAKSREDAKKLFPGDSKKQQEYINFIHDHGGDPRGRNPGDVVEYDLSKECGLPITGPKARSNLPSQYQHRDGNPIDNNPNGKNPGDIIKLGTHHGSSLTKSRATYYEGQVIEGHPKGRNPGDVFRNKPVENIGGMRQSPEPNEPNAFHPCGRNPGDVIRDRDREVDWIKSKGGNESGMRSLSGSTYPYTKDKNPGDFWEICTQPFTGYNPELEHFAVFPLELLWRPLKACCPKGGVVLDPFCGRGTVGRAAKSLGLHYILFDIKPDYCELSRLFIGGQKYKVPKTQMNLDSFA